MQTLEPRQDDLSIAVPSSPGASVALGQPLIQKINRCLEEKKPFYSFEFFPPKTAAGAKNLFTRMHRMAQLEPMFMDVTWGAGGSTADLTLDISAQAQNFCQAEVMTHLTCTNMPITEVKRTLEKVKEAGVRNILALRGDPPKGAEQWEACEGGFEHAVDLVSYIRKEYGDYFGIAVAGYPEGHISATSPADDIKYLKMKVDAGADFVITQLFYDVDVFLEWVKRCRAAGITCPIVPGIMPIQNYNGFKRMTSFCRTRVPPSILRALQPIKQDDSQVKEFGIQLAVQMCKKLHDSGFVGLHFYTLNLERSVTRILQGVGHVRAKTSGQLPWKQSQVSRRRREDVRPIFWANRPNSYLDRTRHWDEFPNGRWGDSSSPAFGDLSDYHLCTYKTGPRATRRQIWGEPKEIRDVYKIFSSYIEGRVPRLPWCENAVQLETVPIKAMLMRMNMCGFLTINSQPRVNGAPSTDPAVGWGGPGGYVYQKAYLEFFTSKRNMERVVAAVPPGSQLQYMAVNAAGDIRSNAPSDTTTAVTWGVFPHQEIKQPTVVDAEAFMVWKDEAFALWQSQWAAIYPKTSPAPGVLQQVHQTFYLVNIVDNDFVHGDIFAFFARIMDGAQ